MTSSLWYDVTFSENSWSNFAYCLEGLVLIRVQTKNAGSAARKVVFLKRNRKKQKNIWKRESENEFENCLEKSLVGATIKFSTSVKFMKQKIMKNLKQQNENYEKFKATK